MPTDKTPATFDYRELPPHFTGDRRCSCGELLECPAAQPAPDLLTAARAVEQQGLDRGRFASWLDGLDAALLAALDWNHDGERGEADEAIKRAQLCAARLRAALPEALR